MKTCSSAREAVDRVIGSPPGGVAILVRRNGKDFDVTLGTMTMFGPVIKRWDGVPESFVARMLADTERAVPAASWVCAPAPFGEGVDTAEDAAAFDLLEAARPGIPLVRAGDRDTAAWWSVALLGDRDGIERGSRLRLRAIQEPGGTRIAYETLDGRDAGIHAVIARDLTDQEAQIVAEAEAVVDRTAYGIGLDEAGGEVRTQVLMLTIPYALATAFPDGRLSLRLPIRKETGDV